jgi:starvation-inducible DNA-binding protein
MNRTPVRNTSSDLGAEATKNLSAALNALLADMFALRIKTKSFAWHMSGPHFRAYHLLLDGHAKELHEPVDSIAERVRTMGADTLRSIGDISRRQRLLDNDADSLPPTDMLAELHEDNRQLAAYLRETHAVCEEYGDAASTRLIEHWLDEAERRAWHLFQTTRSL